MTKPSIEYYENGNIKSEQYRLNGKLHRDPLEGPALIYYYDDGQKDLEQYRSNGKLHRDPEIGPACIYYHDNGEMKWTYYLFDGLLHNPYGPARFHNKHNIFEWYLNGIQYTNEVKEYINNLNYKKMTKIDFDIMWMNLL